MKVKLHNYSEFESITDESIRLAIEHAKSIHGDSFKYEVKKGTSVDLFKLKEHQRVCASKIKGTHILMTKK